MKLKDLLVQELPKRGGWPKDVKHIEMFMDGSIYFDGNLAPRGFSLPQCIDGWASGMPSNYENKVTREQYEASLAAAQQPVWNGEGLPPVGCECEYSLNSGGTWHKCKIDYILGTQGLIMLADVFEGAQYVPFRQYADELKFRPIRSESDKKRDAIIDSLSYYTADCDAIDIYDAIAAGKIPGVKLDV